MFDLVREGGVAMAVKTMSREWVACQVAAIDAGQRMAGESPTDADREAARRVLAGEVTAEQAISEGLAELEREYGFTR